MFTSRVGVFKDELNIVSRKSSRFYLLLFSLFLFGEANASMPTDTIKIDGKYVIIEQVETDYDHDSDFTDDQNDNPDPLWKHRAYWKTGTRGLMSLTGLSHDQDINGEALHTVNEFLGDPYNSSFGFGLDGAFGYYLPNEAFSIETGLTYQFSSYKSKYFTELDLLDQDEVGYDEFIGFYSGSGGELFQVVRFQIDLLAYKDSSVVINISDEKMKVHQVQIPLMFRYETQKENLKKLNFHAAAGVGLRFLFHQDDFRTVLLNTNGQFEEVIIEANQLKSMNLYGLLNAGMQYHLNDHKTSLFCEFYLGQSLSPIDSSTKNIQIRHREFGIGLGIKRNLSKS